MSIPPLTKVVKVHPTLNSGDQLYGLYGHVSSTLSYRCRGSSCKPASPERRDLWWPQINFVEQRVSSHFLSCCHSAVASLLQQVPYTLPPSTEHHLKSCFGVGSWTAQNVAAKKSAVQGGFSSKICAPDMHHSGAHSQCH